MHNPELDSRSYQIIAMIDGMVAPEIDNVGEIIMPQLEFVVALSGMGRVFDDRKNFIDGHHLFFPRSAYVTPLERRFRGTFIIPTVRYIHDELHAAIPPPLKPSRGTMLAYLAEIGHSSGS